VSSSSLVIVSPMANKYSLASPFPASSAKVTITYPNGALRITRTPGRQNTKNCVNLQDVIHKQHLLSACVFSFFIGDNELYDHLPLSHSSDAVPVSKTYTPH
jgi:tyrosyl-DNA phosphodiesterase-1